MLLDKIIEIYEKGPYTIKRDRMDDVLFNRHREKLIEKVKTLPETLPQIPPLISDTFCAFYKPRPKFLDDSQIAPEFLVNKCVLSKMMKTEAFTELKESTTLDDVNSAIATAIFVERLYEELKRVLEKMKEHTEAIRKLRSELKSCGDAQQLDQKLQQIERHANSLRNLVTQGAVSAAVRKAKQEFEEVRNMMHSLSFGTQPGHHTMMDPEEAVKLAVELRRNSTLRKIIEMLGRMRNLLRSTSKSKPKPSRLEIHSVTMGKDVQRLLPSELLKLKKCKLAFYKDYYEGKLMSYELKRREKEVKGPLVIVQDFSESMRGLKDTWAKAVSLATIDLAIKESRSWAFVAFEKRVIYTKLFKKRPNPKDVLEIIKLSPAGGTDFEEALRATVEVIAREKDFSEADVLFISDGESKVSQKFLEKFKQFKVQKGIHVVGILISGKANVMKKFCDEVIELKGRIGYDAAELVFRKIV